MTTTPDSRATLRLDTIDPANLTVRDQAREDATPDDQLVASIRKHGIIQPPVVEINGDGEWVIVTGHRRVGAAIAAGLTEITVLIRPAAAEDAITLEQQIVENERRKQLSAKDLAAGFQKLTLFGLRPEDIAAGLGEKPERIRAGLKVNASEKTAELLEQEPSIDLERAAIIAEFDAHPKLQKDLIQTATTRPENFDRDVAHARTQREVDARVASLTKQLDAENVALADVNGYDTDWWTGKGAGAGKGRTLDRLGIRVEEHVDCPGHAAIIHRAQSYYLKDDPSEWIRYVCTDWEANGHELPSQVNVREKTPEDLEREAERERQQQEERERRALVDANSTVRRAWITTHLTTGRLRPVVAHFDLLAAALRAELHHEEGGEERVVLQILDGNERPRPADWRDTSIVDELLELIETDRVSSTRIALARAFAYFEENSRYAAAAAAPYWTALEALGYTLTDTDKTHQAAAIAAEAEWFADRAGETLTGDPHEDDIEDGDDDEDGDDQ